MAVFSFSCDKNLIGFIGNILLLLLLLLDQYVFCVETTLKENLF